MKPAAIFPLTLLAAWAGIASAGDFAADVAAFLHRHCIDCHSGPDAEMGLTLDGFRDEAAVLADRPRWRKILSRVESDEMPPAESDRPAAAERDAFMTAVRAKIGRAHV